LIYIFFFISLFGHLTPTITLFFIIVEGTSTYSLIFLIFFSKFFIVFLFTFFKYLSPYGPFLSEKTIPDLDKAFTKSFPPLELICDGTKYFEKLVDL
jgi:hypothetical protein